MNCVGIILAGGTGIRFKSQTPKQYMKLNGKELIEYSIDAFIQAESISNIICVLDSDEFKRKRIEEKYDLTCIKGGKTRNESIKLALDYIHAHLPSTELVFIHEAARPLINPSLINDFINKIIQNKVDAVITAVDITDSIGYKNGKLANRNEYHLIQTPECFKFNILFKHFDQNSEITSTSHQLPSNTRIKYQYSTSSNLKVTYPEDLFLAEQILKYNYFKTTNLNSPVEVQKSFTRKKALVFGSSGGLGKEIKITFESLGIELLCPTKEELNLKDLNVEKILNYCKDFFPDIIINSAAYAISDEHGLTSKFDEVFHINTKANLVLIDFARKLNKQVNLVLISSSASTRGRENLTLYSASKCALNSIVESMAKKLSKEKVFINTLIPEKINTPLIESLHKIPSPSSELLNTSDVIHAIYHFATTEEYGKLVHIRKGL